MYFKKIINKKNMFGNKKDDVKKDENLKDLENEIKDLEEKENSENLEKQEGKTESCEEKYEALNDKYLRLIAEFENFKRRTSEEKIQNFRIGGKQVLTSILPFLDNFKRAVDSCSKELMENDWVKGILSVEKNLISDLEKIGFKKIDAEGEKFDFKKHEALMQNPEVEKDIVASVLEEGYEYNGEVVRHVKVSVGCK